MPSNRRWLEGLAGVRCDHPLARYTSFGIGGPADYFVESAEPGRLVEACSRRGIPYLLLGAGTNLLVSDLGVEGLVIRCINRGWRIQGTRVFAESGLKMMRLARICADHDLRGLEWAIGVPGSVGGAVYQDAGCWGSELRQVLAMAIGLRPGVGRQEWTPVDLELGYRTSALRQGRLRGAVVEGVWLELAAGDGAEARRRMAALVRERSRTQPIATRNCGSVFKNPPGDSAGRLIEAAGLRGEREGAAMVSLHHANFIENLGGATAEQVDRLIERVKAAVAEQFGVALECEVERVGRWPEGRVS